MTFTNSVMIPKKDITTKNHENSTQLKMQTKYQPNAKLTLELLAYANDKQSSSV